MPTRRSFKINRNLPGRFNSSKYSLLSSFYKNYCVQNNNEEYTYERLSILRKKYNLSYSDVKKLARKRILFLLKFKNKYYALINPCIDAKDLEDYL